MKRRNPAFIILIFLFWYYSTIRERKKPLLQDIFHKVRVTNLTQGGLKAMEELAKLEAERGNPDYLETEYRGDVRGGRDIRRDRDTREQTYVQTAAAGRSLRGAGSGESFRKYESAGRGSQGKGAGRRASNEMCIFLILNISSLQLIPVNMIAYRAQYGSANPTAIIAPAITATLVSTLVAIVYCKFKDRGGKAV